MFDDEKFLYLFKNRSLETSEGLTNDAGLLESDSKGKPRGVWC